MACDFQAMGTIFNYTSKIAFCKERDYSRLGLGIDVHREIGKK